MADIDAVCALLDSGGKVEWDSFGTYRGSVL
jgi:hypothetical protein